MTYFKLAYLTVFVLCIYEEFSLLRSESEILTFTEHLQVLSDKGREEVLHRSVQDCLTQNIT